jgi:hypothetical protein
MARQSVALIPGIGFPVEKSLQRGASGVEPRERAG